MTKIFPLFFTLLAVILSSLMIYDGHNWGGDFAQYISQAISLVNGNV